MEFRRYRVLSDLFLGQYNRTLAAGEEIEYNGVTLRFPDTGETLSLPLLAKAIQGGAIVVPADSEETSYRPRPAGVQVRPATAAHQERGEAMSTVTVSEEDAQVGTVGRANERRHAAYSGQPLPPQERQPMRRAASVDEADAVNSAILQDILNQPFVKADLSRIGGNRYDEPEGAGGKKTRSGFSAAVLSTDGYQGEAVKTITGSPNSAVVGSPEEARRIAAAGAGVRMDKTRPEDIEPPIPVSLSEQVQAKQAARQPQGRAQVIYPEGDEIVDLSGRTAAPRLQHPQTQVQARPGVQGIGETFGNGATGDVPTARAGVSLEDLLPGAAAPAPRTAAPKKSREQVVQEIVSGWDTNRPWQERVEEAVDFYGNSPDILDAIYQVEGPGVVRKIKEALGAAEPPKAELIKPIPSPAPNTEQRPVPRVPPTTSLPPRTARPPVKLKRGE